MSALADNMTFDSLRRHGIEPDVEQESVGVDDLDRLAGPRAQRSREVPRIGALDHHSPAPAVPEESRQRLPKIPTKSEASP